MHTPDAARVRAPWASEGAKEQRTAEAVLGLLTQAANDLVAEISASQSAFDRLTAKHADRSDSADRMARELAALRDELGALGDGEDSAARRDALAAQIADVSEIEAANRAVLDEIAEALSTLDANLVRMEGQLADLEDLRAKFNGVAATADASSILASVGGAA